MQHECSACSRKPDPAWQGFADSSAIRHHTQINKQKPTLVFASQEVSAFFWGATRSLNHTSFSSMEGKRLWLSWFCLPYPPQVIKEPILKLWQEQSDGCLCVHADDSLPRAQRRVPHKLILVCQGLHRGTKGALKTEPFSTIHKSNRRKTNQCFLSPPWKANELQGCECTKMTSRND